MLQGFAHEPAFLDHHLLKESLSWLRVWVRGLGYKGLKESLSWLRVWLRGLGYKGLKESLAKVFLHLSHKRSHRGALITSASRVSR